MTPRQTNKQTNRQTHTHKKKRQTPYTATHAMVYVQCTMERSLTILGQHINHLISVWSWPSAAYKIDQKQHMHYLAKDRRTCVVQKKTLSSQKGYCVFSGLFWFLQFVPGFRVSYNHTRRLPQLLIIRRKCFL